MATLPIKGSMNYRMCEFIYRNGGRVGKKELSAYFSEINSKYSCDATSRVAQYGYIQRDESDVILAPHVQRYFDGMDKQEKYKGEIVKPAEPRPFKPLTGYTASLTRNLREPIREMSFMRTSSQCLPRQ